MRPIELTTLTALLALPAAALEARIERVGGVPTLVVNGEPIPPFLLFHTAGGGAVAKPCAVTNEWQRFTFTFRAPVDDDNVGIHVRNVAPVGAWYVDDVSFREGPVDEPVGPELLRGGDFEGETLPEAWAYFLNDSAGARVEYTLDRAAPHGGRSCLRVNITSPGQAIYEIHIYQRVAISQGKTYTCSVWLRSEEPRTVEIQAVHQGPPWNIYGGETAASDRILALGAERDLHLGTPPMHLPWPQGDEPPDYAGVDAQVRHILDVDPEALIVPRIHLDAPEWWKAEHPGHRQRYDDGEHPMASPASPDWKRDAAEALRLLLRHLEARWGEHMLGYHITGQSAGEWFYDHTWERIMPCFEEPFRAAFAAWAEAKYGTVDALRAAWGQPEVTFETIRVPTLAERTTGLLGAFRDPVRQRFEIDFAEYMQVCLCEDVEFFARVAREETGGRKLGVFFYGYLYDVAGFVYGGAVSGHLRLRRLLDCPDVDIICSPISYFDRGAGGVGPFMSPVDSIQAHGKLWVNEDDARTHLAPLDANFGRTDTMAETIGVYRRNFGHQLERRCGTWWMDFGTGWMADPTIFDNFARTRDIWREAGPAEPFAPEVAIVTDEDTFLYLRHSNAETAPAVSHLRREVNTMGCPVGHWLLEDVCDGLLPERVRLMVFLNAWNVTPSQRERLRRNALRDGRTAVWLYAPGYLDGARADPALIADLTGIAVSPAQAGAAVIRITAGALSGHRFGVDARPDPLFAAVGGDGVTVLGVYDGTTEAGLAARQLDDWRSVFCGSLSVDAAVLRELAREAGAHVWCESNDVVSGDGRFVSIHASSSGEKTIILPRPAGLRDLYGGERLAPAERHSFPLERGETRLFAIEAR